MTINFLQQYLRINTSYPTYDYDRVIDLFIQQAGRDGFATRKIVLDSGLPVLVITITGRDSSLPALMLNHRMDVVPATGEAWIADPFAGAIMNKVIIGRGTQDMKGVGVAHYMAAREVYKNLGTPERTIHIVLVPHEEVGGFLGTKQFVEHPLFTSLNIGYVLDEGQPSGNHKQLLCKISERSPLQIEVTATGTAAHGSSLLADNPLHTLVKFLDKLCALQEEQKHASTQTAPGLLTSYNITSLSAGSSEALNVIPGHAQATVDIRIAPEETSADIQAKLDALCALYTNVTYIVRARGLEQTGIGDMSGALATTCEHATLAHGLTLVPHYFEGATDARFYAQRGIETIGLTPFISTPNLHGINESLTCAELLQGQKIFEHIIKHFCYGEHHD